MDTLESDSKMHIAPNIFVDNQNRDCILTAEVFSTIPFLLRNTMICLLFYKSRII